MSPNVGGCAIYGRLGILVSVALLGSVIIQMSSLGRATDVQHNYPVYLNCHLSHLASRTLPPSSISQTLSTDSTKPRNLVPFNVKPNQTFQCLSLNVKGRYWERDLAEHEVWLHNWRRHQVKAGVVRALERGSRLRIPRRSQVQKWRAADHVQVQEDD